MQIRPKEFRPPIKHRFADGDFEGFSTANTIQKYGVPEILFIGTYNPDTEVAANRADFFYGRNYFWPTMFNLFQEGAVVHTHRRDAFNPFEPVLSTLLNLGLDKGMTFADLIKGVFPEGYVYRITGNKVTTYHRTQYNLIEDNALSQLHNLGQVDWATANIIQYIRDTPSLKWVRLTRQPEGVWKPQWNQIKDADYGRERKVDFGTIHTPSGMGLQEKGITIAKALARRWVHHPAPNKRLPTEWLLEHGVEINNFNYPDPPLPLF